MSTAPFATTIDGLDVLAITRPNTTRTVVMLHGYGADYEDLAPLAAHLDPHRSWNWIFPNGILAVPIGPHMQGHAWFPIRISELEAAAQRGELVDFADEFPDGMLEARRRLTSLIHHLRVPAADLVLGGFSQGAMMAVEVAAHLPDRVAALLLFSGTLINRKAWIKALPGKAPMRFLQSHGRADPLLGFAHAERLYETLGKAGLQGEFVPFDGGHEIPPSMVGRAAALLGQLATSP
jgi:phospholipase/carboxylesterase